MNDQPAMSRHVITAPAGVPVAVWLLLSGALVTVIVGAVAQGLTAAYPDVSAGRLIGLASTAMTFVLAAVVVLGARRWAQGRRLLLAGALLIAVRGVMDLGLEAYFAWWWSTDPRLQTDAERTLLTVRAFVGGISLVTAFALLGLGLWAARSRPLAPTRGRLAWTAVIGTIGVVAAAGALVVAAAYASAPLDAANGVLQAMLAIQAMALAAVGIAALWCRPDVDPLPEVAIAVGVALVVATMAWSQWFLALVPPQDVDFAWIGWAYTLPSGLGLVGLIAMAIGFFTGRTFGAGPRAS